MRTFIFGTFNIDDIVLPNHTMSSIVGGAAVYASLASSLFSDTAVGGMAGNDFPQEFIDFLSKRGIDTSCIQRSKDKPSFRWKARYSDDLTNITTTYQAMNATEDMDATACLDVAKNCKAVFVSNVDPEKQYDLVSNLPTHTIKMLDSMDLWMVEKRDHILKTLKHVDVYFVSEHEGSLLIDKEVPTQELVSEIMSLGPKVVILKKGRHGLSMYGKMGTISVPSYPLTHAIDPSGAGDSLGGVIASVISKLGKFDHEAMVTALHVGTVVASFVVEDYGFDKLKVLTQDEVINRARLFMDQIPNVSNVLLEQLGSE